MSKNTLHKKKNFRIAAKRIYLTYSQVNKDMENTDVLKILQSKNFFCFKYLISKEYHLDGGTHFHVLLEATNKFDIKDAAFLDIKYQENSYHGNYQPVRSFPNVVRYICKAGDYITDLTNIREGKVLTAKEILIERALEIGVSKALIEHCKQLPNKALPNLSLTSAKAFFKSLDDLKQQEEDDQIQTPFGLQDFDLKSNKELQDWILNPAKTLVLAGPSGVGKTQFCKAYAQSKALKALVINHTEDFKKLDDKHECVVIDDANLHQLDTTQLLAVIDNTVQKTLRVLYTTVNKKPGLTQMLTMNKPEYEKIKNLFKQKRFSRRLVFSEIKDCIINLNVNIQINNTTNHNYAAQKDLEQAHLDGNRQRMQDYEGNAA